MQAVILAGGLATRLGNLTKEIPKSMIMVNRRPFLEHQLDLFKAIGVKDFVLCVGHLSSVIKKHFGNGELFGVNIRYSIEKDSLLGTGGALKNAEDLLEDEFFVMYGDSYLPIDYRKPLAHFHKFNKLGLNVVYKNMDRYDKSNIAVKDGVITEYSKGGGKQIVYIDAGLSIFKKEILDLIPENRVLQLYDLFNKLIDNKELLAFETKQRFYEIGSLSGLSELEAFLSKK